MRKYNMSNENSSTNNGCRWSNRSFPFFDIPCLYYPQYSCNWSHCSQNDYAIFGLSYPNSNDNNLNLSPQVIDGRCIQLSSDNDTVMLQPGRLYQLNYQVTANINNTLTVFPVVDSISDLCNATTVTGPEGINSTQTLCGSLLLPVVETVSTLQIQIQSTPASPEQLHGTVSVVSLSNL